jgi:hypothetical protein
MTMVGACAAGGRDGDLAGGGPWVCEVELGGAVVDLGGGDDGGEEVLAAGALGELAGVDVAGSDELVDGLDPPPELVQPLRPRSPTVTVATMPRPNARRTRSR